MKKTKTKEYGYVFVRLPKSLKNRATNTIKSLETTWTAVIYDLCQSLIKEKKAKKNELIEIKGLSASLHHKKK